jgi:tRNA dimethylallyltransferase
MKKSEPIFLAGPTAVGKSAVALELAQRIGGEIITVDSMQVYRGLDIGTAKPSGADRAQVFHHLVDVVDLNGAFDAARFVDLALRAEAEIKARGRVPVYCGGTGLYFKARLEGLGEAPPSDAVLRAELEQIPLAELVEELRREDPLLHAKIDLRNPRRVIRAVEVIRLTGRPFSGQRAAWSSSAPSGSNATTIRADSSRVRLFGLSRQAGDLRERIDRRVDEMFARGLVEETRHLLGLGLEQNGAAMQSIGYRQVVEHLRGDRPLGETIERVKTRTRQFAKRQMTWFRRQLDMDWIECPGARSVNDSVEEILSRRTAG